jgi:hypothetical protein
MKIMACAKPLKWLMKAAAKRRRNGERSWRSKLYQWKKLKCRR